MTQPSAPQPETWPLQTCPQCHGTGRIHDEQRGIDGECPTCDGTGKDRYPPPQQEKQALADYAKHYQGKVAPQPEHAGKTPGKCINCNGTGESRLGDDADHAPVVCPICKGTGNVIPEPAGKTPAEEIRVGGNTMEMVFGSDTGDFCGETIQEDGKTPGQVALTFDAFSRINRQRCESPDGFNHALNSWSRSDWMTAVVGELGEAANFAKKLNRVRDGIPGNKEPESELRAAFIDELADTFIYLDLLAQSEGINFAAAVADKFNRTSKKIGSSIVVETAAQAEDESADIDSLLMEVARLRREQLQNKSTIEALRQRAEAATEWQERAAEAAQKEINRLTMELTTSSEQLAGVERERDSLQATVSTVTKAAIEAAKHRPSQGYTCDACVEVEMRIAAANARADEAEADRLRATRRADDCIQQMRLMRNELILAKDRAEGAERERDIALAQRDQWSGLAEKLKETVAALSAVPPQPDPATMQRSMDDYDAGRSRPLQDVIAELQEKYPPPSEDLKPIASIIVSRDGNSMDVCLDTSLSTYGEWIKGEGGDISLTREQETNKLAGAHLPLYAKTLMIAGDNFEMISIDLESGRVNGLGAVPPTAEDAEDLTDSQAEKASGVSVSHDELLRELEAIPSAASQWIPVGERLPEATRHGLSDDVLIVSPGIHGIVIANYSHASERWIVSWINGDINVTHWQPLPSPPTSAAIAGKDE